jgi:hypothetical protein
MKNLYVLLLFLLPLLLPACSPGVSIEESSYGGRPHYLVKTKTLTYYYDISGGGFSRILDRQGNDWIGFKREPWGEYPASAASSYRGLPNLVFQHEDDGAGHPGFDQCKSRVEDGRIITESLSGKWKWSWTFHGTYAVLDILKTDPDRGYWFLYEGTPGGSFDPAESYYGSDKGGPYPAGHDYYKGEILWDQFRWMYVGTTHTGGVFYMVQESKDSFMDLISFLGNTESGMASPDGMTVFGFGREKGARPLLQSPQRFIIGFYPEKIKDQKGHQQLSSYLHRSFLK